MAMQKRAHAGRSVDQLECRLLLSTIYVDAIAPGPTHDGSSWGNAYTDLQQALSIATSGTTIEVAQGTYKPTSGTDRTISFDLKNGVAIYGGYAGYGASNPDARDVAAYPTILSGDIGLTGNNSDNSNSVVVASDTNATAVLDGFTITDGNANGNLNTGSAGAGILDSNGSPTIRNCALTGNVAIYGGGLLVTGQSAAPVLTNCTLEDNTSQYGAGADVTTNATLTLTDCTFEDNIVNTALNQPADGAGIDISGASLNASGCTFTGNSAESAGLDEGAGGGIYFYDSGNNPGNITLANCSFNGNSANGESGTLGAGVYIENPGASSSIVGCTFSNNIGSDIYINYSSISIVDCSFVGNTVASVFIYEYSSPSITGCEFEDNAGEAIDESDACSPQINQCSFIGNSLSGDSSLIYSSDDCSPKIIACTFKGNVDDSSNSGGALVYGFFESSITLINCTLVGNSIGTLIFNNDGYGQVTNCTFAGNSCDYITEDVMVANSIIWDNTLINGTPFYYFYDGTTPVSYSDVQSGYPGTGNIDEDPLFLQDPNPGPDNVWGTSDDDDGDLQLSPASPAVDAGNNSAVPAGVTTDCAGNPRFQDVPTSSHTGSGTVPIVDMGAYEAAPSLAASSGGPYEVLVGQSLKLNGRGSSSVSGTLQYAWDWSGNGLFNDANVVDPAFPVSSFAPGSVVNVALKVTDASGQSTISDTTVRIMPTTIYVDPAAPGANNGVDWGDAFTSLANALNLALPGQTIDVSQGTYTPTTTQYPSYSFTLNSDIQLYGGYAGYGTANPDARDPEAFTAILSGDLGMAGGSTIHSNSVVVANFANANTLIDGFTISGGQEGLSANESSLAIDNCIFSDNLGNGGIGLYQGRPTVNGCTFFDNSGEYGGGASLSSECILTDCVFQNNQGTYGGGAYVDFYPSTLINCEFLGNSAPFGAGLYADSDLPTPLTNCLFVGNTASQGGAIYAYDYFPLLTNCTIAGNSASTGGGAVYSQIYSYPFSSIVNAIIWDNSAPSGPEFLNAEASPVAAYSDIQGGYAGEDNNSADPQFIRAPSPGPDGVWGTADDDYGDLHLQFTSPCIDSGLNAALPADITTDLDGDPRIFDFPGVNDPGAIVDRGAYELGYNLDQVTVPAGQTVNLPAGGYPFAVNSLSIGTGGTLNIADDTLTVKEVISPQDAINPSAAGASIIADITNGTGGGIVSTLPGSNSNTYTSMGYFESGSQITIGRTWLGDANLDGVINADDLTLMLLGQLQHGTRWQDGNFNYDNQVNADDWMELFAALAYSKGQPLSTFSNSPSSQPSAASTMMANQPKLAASQFATTPIASDEDLSGLLDSSQLFEGLPEKNQVLI